MATMTQSDICIPVKRKRRRILLILMILIVPLLLFAGYTWVALHYSYSWGERSGYVQKISKKGWLCKTWEGELAMTTVPGTAPQIFDFTVKEDGVANQVQQAAGRRVALSYQQHKGLPSSCFGDTEYFVTGVRIVGQ